MWLNLKKILFYLTVLQIVIVKFRKVESNTLTEGARALADGLGNAAVGDFLSINNKPQEIQHHHLAAASNASTGIANLSHSPPKPVTTIEKAETLPNGCYKQFLKEPIPNNTTQFVQTEQLICPQTNPATKVDQPTFVHIAPVVVIPAVPAVHMIHVPVKIEPIIQDDKNFSSANPEPVQTAPLQPLQPNSSTAVPATINNTSSSTPVAAVYPVQSANRTIIEITESPQVTILSKTIGSYDEDKKKKNNTARCLFENNFTFLLAICVVLKLF